MDINPTIVLRRCKRTLDDRIYPFINTSIGTCTARMWQIPGEPIPYTSFFDKLKTNEVTFKPLQIGDFWGTTWGTTWIEVSGYIDSTHVRTCAPNLMELEVDLGWDTTWPGGHFEALVYKANGTVIKALNPKNQWIPLSDSLQPDNTFTVYIEASCMPMLLKNHSFRPTQLGEGPTGEHEDPAILKRLSVCKHNADLSAYASALTVIYESLGQLDNNTRRYWQLISALRASLNVYDARNIDTSLPTAFQLLENVLSKEASPSTLKHIGVGHSHIDSAWLWPKRETRRKVARTVSNMLALMDRYPEFTYVMSSAQQYTWLQQDHPDLFDRLKQRVREGRFIPVGSMWVESDGMIPSGESLIRQISYGKQYFQNTLDTDTHGIWLPDSFGYTANFPQIARRSGLEWFLTQKISWNDTTVFPQHTFTWRGLDGTGITTHFPPSNTYAAEVTAKEFLESEHNFKNKDFASEALYLFGYGDGGGGATRDMVEKFDLYRSFEGISKAEYGHPDAFFHNASQEIATASYPPQWRGDLYLELHRKTLTSQQAMKKGCRTEESLLRIVEYLASYASLVNRNYSYPYEILDDIWKTLLLNQFHDILPGSAIAWVHREAREDYARDINRLYSVANESIKAISQSEDLHNAPCQEQTKIVPSYSKESWVQVRATDTDSLDELTISSSKNTYILNNQHLQVTIDGSGAVVSILDKKSQRNIVPNNKRLGIFEILRDEPSQWDAWDLEKDSLSQKTSINNIGDIKIIKTPSAVGVEVTYKFGISTIVNKITLEVGQRYLRFQTNVDWHETEKMLRVALPLSTSATHAHYERQYGEVSYPIMQNYDADKARFEICTHRYIKITDPSLTIGIVNASTYGGHVEPLYEKDTVIGAIAYLSLLASANYPDPNTDRGEHTFEYSIIVSENPVDIVEHAYYLNSPTMENVPRLPSLITIKHDCGYNIIDWIKLANDRSGDIIIRMYEPNGDHASGVLQANSILKNATVCEVDALETNPLPDGLTQAMSSTPIPLEGAKFELNAFQFATLRIHIPQ